MSIDKNPQMRTLCNIIALVLLLVVPRISEGQSLGRPNILLITADDLGLQVGCYGDKLARTPHIDRLAQQGVKFTNGYVTQASCSSSRSSILTGTFPHQNGQVGLAHLGFSMHEDVITLPQLLKKNGYRTGIIGKLHVGPEKNFPFDFSYAQHAASKTRDVKDVAKVASTFMIKDGDDPFFLMVNYLDPHEKFIPQINGLPKNPYQSKDVDPLPFQLVGNPEQMERVANFYSCIERLDEGLGLLMEVLAQSGKAENTLVIFIGDHGAPFSRGKTSCYEAGLKIPYIVRYPARINKENEDDHLVSTVDLMPTILDLAEITVPKAVEGNSLVSLLGEEEVAWRRYLFGEFFYHVPDTYFPRYSVRNERYKLIYNLKDTKNPILSIDNDQAYEMSQGVEYKGTLTRDIFNRFATPPKFELYDLEADPNELNNLANDPYHQETLKDLWNQMEKWLSKTNAPRS